MLAIGVRVLLACGVAALLGACSTPCERLCAPITSITSGSPAPPLPPPPRASAPAAAAPPAVQTFAVENPDIVVEAGTPPAGAERQIRIGLILPLRSETLGEAAEALRAGFMAGYERERDGFAVNIVETGDSGQEALASYALAVEQNDIVVGPLARSAVSIVAASALVRKPTLALNHPDRHGDATPLPQNMLIIGLSVEDEARQLAAWAAAEQPGAQALILSAGQPWQRRAGAAFAAQWTHAGRSAQSIALGTLNGHLNDAELVQLRTRIQDAPDALLFAALDADQVRQLRAALGNDIPIYGTSSLNPGAGALEAAPELDGVRLLDLPWQVQRDHPAVMVYPRPLPGGAHTPSADLERLYALGIDAFRVAREIALHPASSFHLDGVTGRLAVSFGRGPARFERTEQSAMYRAGALLPLPGPQ